MISEIYRSRKSGINSLCEAIAHFSNSQACACPFPANILAFRPLRPDITLLWTHISVLLSDCLLQPDWLGWQILSAPSQGLVCVMGLHLSLLGLGMVCLCTQSPSASIIYSVLGAWGHIRHRTEVAPISLAFKVL